MTTWELLVVDEANGKVVRTWHARPEPGTTTVPMTKYATLQEILLDGWEPLGCCQTLDGWVDNQPCERLSFRRQIPSTKVDYL